MQSINPDTARVETVLGGLLYMMTLYQRHRCRRCAAAIAAHLDCLARHPDADVVIQEIAQGLWSEWRAAAGLCLQTVAAPGASRRSTSLN